MKDPKLEYLDYWYSLSGNLGCTKSFGLKVWMQQQKKIDDAIAKIDRAMNCCESIETECVLSEIRELLK